MSYKDAANRLLLFYGMSLQQASYPYGEAITAVFDIISAEIIVKT